MVPVLATAARLVITQTQTLKHSALLLMWTIVYGTGTETIAEVLIVLVVGVGLLRVDVALRVGVRVDA
jgi:hypothetical protein